MDWDGDSFYDDEDDGYSTALMELYFHAETAKAILVSEEGNSIRAVWIPKSQIHGIKGDKVPGAVIEVAMAQWVAEDRGLC